MRKKWTCFLAVLAFATGVYCLRSEILPSRNRVSINADLAEAKQKHIWNLEHAAFEIETKVGKTLAAALQQRDESALLSFVRDDFRASVPAPQNQTEVRPGSIHQVERGLNTTERVDVDATGWADHLVHGLEQFREVQSVKLRVLTIDSPARDSSSSDWELTMLLTARGVSTTDGPIEWESKHRIRCQFESDAEIASGKILRRWDTDSELLRTSPQALMSEVTADVGLSSVDLPDNWTGATPASQYSFQMAVDDFDRDGFWDIAVAAIDGRRYLLRSIRGERFEDAAEQLGISHQPTVALNESGAISAVPIVSYLATWIDYDSDRFPDLILGNSLYHNEHGLRFVDVTAQSGLRFGVGPMGCAVADYDCDGLLDLYVLYQAATERRTKPLPWVGDDESGAENQLWRNLGGGRFNDVTQAARAGGGKRHTFAASWFHANDDIFPDLYIANDFGRNILLHNRGNGKFKDVSKTTRVGDYSTSMGVTTGDIDNDGINEIYVANMYSKMGRRIIAHLSEEDYPKGVLDQIRGSCSGNTLYKRSHGQSTYREISEQVGVNPVGWAYAPHLVDLDGDGFLDIYATAGFMSFDRQKPDG